MNKSIVAGKKFDNSSAKEVIKTPFGMYWNNWNQKTFITSNLCIEIMQRIKKNTSWIRTTPGTILSNNKGEVIYTPPFGKEVITEKLSNLEKFINEHNQLDPLIKMS